MNHNHIYSDSVSCEQLKAVDIISKEEGHVCPEAGQIGPKPNRPQVKIIEELKLSSKYSCVLYQ